MGPKTAAAAAAAAASAASAAMKDSALTHVYHQV